MTDVNMSAAGIDTARGLVKFTVAGSGPPILYFHGTPSSSRLAIELEHRLIADGFQLIVPQRPGYYGTPLGDRVTTADCAEMAAQVLDHLQIGQVAAMGTSGGGPPALAFAARYPDRTTALVLQCAQTHRWDDVRWAPQSHRWLWWCFRWGFSRWLFCRFFPTLFRLAFPSPEHYLRDLTGSRFAFAQNEPGARQFAKGIFDGLGEFHQVRAGYRNDLATWMREDVPATKQVYCPTLVLHDPSDPGAPFRHAEYAAERISGAELVPLETAGHLLWYGRDAALMHERRVAFLREHLADR